MIMGFDECSRFYRPPAGQDIFVHAREAGMLNTGDRVQN